MGGANEKGKIPRTEWSSIAARYGRGESLASIARAYGCTAPAIRYIVRRSSAAKGQREAQRRPAGKSYEPMSGGNRLRSMTKGDPLAPYRSAELSADLYQRITREISAFLVALDTALVEPSSTAHAMLHEAADRLMRAAARLRIALEERDHQTPPRSEQELRVEPERH
jgi:hypothetical protein